MKKILLGILSCLALSVSAQTYTFTTAGSTGMNGPDQIAVDAAYLTTNLNGLVTINTQGIQEWTVPYTGTYQIQAIGASGGNSVYATTILGGGGSDLTGEFTLTAGSIVQVLVGQMGETDAVGGGGGGSFIAVLNVPQIVAGGGGGASSDQAGIASVVTNNGTMGSMNVISGGAGGNGGNACTTGDNNGGAGGGFLTDGTSPNTGIAGNNNGFGGLSFLNGGIGGLPGRTDGACSEDPYGGFGGGGSGTCFTVGGGGGGGYSGGAGGQHFGNCGGGSVRAGGGGGGSFNMGTSAVELSGTNIGDGSVIITVLCSPTMMILDLATLADVNDECSSDPIPPTATNDCGATINGVPDVTMPITTPGTTLVTWTYDDGQGNTTSQTQNVILTDVTAPVADSTNLPDLTDICGATSLTAPTATDNCMGTITGTTTTTFPISTPGASVITWTFDDGSGNTSTQTQNILNGAIDDGIQLVGSLLNATELVGTYQWLDCESNYAIISGETGQYYDATVTGQYAVEISQGGCKDTSECLLVDFTSIDEVNLQNVTIYPNPTQGDFMVSTPGIIESINVVDVLGRTISLPINLVEGTVNGAELKSGNYFVIVTTEKGTFTREVIVLN